MSESIANTESIPNLWPGEFKVDVQTPYTILRIQANLLGKMTSAILVGDVETERDEKAVQHRLVVVAPACNGYRHTLITARHDPHLPYPAEVRAEALAEKVPHDISMNYPPGVTGFDTTYPRAASDDEMRQLVERALHSDQTKAVILSLIAISNEAKASPPAGAQIGAGDTGTSTEQGP